MSWKSLQMFQPFHMLQDRFTHPLLGNKILKKLPIEEEQTNIFSQLVFFILSIDREKRCNEGGGQIWFPDNFRF